MFDHSLRSADNKRSVGDDFRARSKSVNMSREAPLSTLLALSTSRYDNYQAPAAQSRPQNRCHTQLPAAPSCTASRVLQEVESTFQPYSSSVQTLNQPQHPSSLLPMNHSHAQVSNRNCPAAYSIQAGRQAHKTTPEPADSRDAKIWAVLSGFDNTLHSASTANPSSKSPIAFQSMIQGTNNT